MKTMEQHFSRKHEYLEWNVLIVFCVSACMYDAFFGTTVSNTKYIWCSVRICLADIYVVCSTVGNLYSIYCLQLTLLCLNLVALLCRQHSVHPGHSTSRSRPRLAEMYESDNMLSFTILIYISKHDTVQTNILLITNCKLSIGQFFLMLIIRHVSPVG